MEVLVENPKKKDAVIEAIRELEDVDTDNHVEKVIDVLEHIQSQGKKKVKGWTALQSYNGLIRELSYQTPISAIINSSNKHAYEVFRSFLKKESNNFLCIQKPES